MTENGKVRIYTWTPDEFRTLLERNQLKVERIVGKRITMPLRIKKETYIRKDYPEDPFNKILKFELAICERALLSGTRNIYADALLASSVFQNGVFRNTTLNVFLSKNTP
jgi:hypothetical protein